MNNGWGKVPLHKFSTHLYNQRCEIQHSTAQLNEQAKSPIPVFSCLTVKHTNLRVLKLSQFSVLCYNAPEREPVGTLFFVFSTIRTGNEYKASFRRTPLCHSLLKISLVRDISAVF